MLPVGGFTSVIAASAIGGLVADFTSLRVAKVLVLVRWNKINEILCN